LLSTDLFTWESLLLTNPDVSYDPITGQVEVLGDADEPTLYFRLKGSRWPSRNSEEKIHETASPIGAPT